MAKAKIGVKAKAYRNSGTYGTPTWSEIDIISDLTVNDSWNVADSSIRNSRIDAEEVTTKKLGVTCKIRNDDDDTNFIALLAAQLAGTALDLLVLDGANTVDGSQGYRGYFKIKKWDNDQSRGVVQFFDTEFTPSSASTEMKSAAVASSTLSYTAIDP